MKDIAELLASDHERLDALFQETIDAAHAGVDLRTLGEIWGRFRAGLLGHLRAEETLLFPLFAARRPIDVGELRKEHADIREQLDLLDLEVDLHLVRSPRIEAFVALLREHAHVEDEGLYSLADELLDAAGKDELRAAIGTHR